MNDTPPKSILTHRLSLRAGKIDDADALFANYTSSEKASKYLQRKLHSSIEDTKSFLMTWGDLTWGDDGRYAWTVAPRDNDEVIGVIILLLHKLEAELHFGISPNWWGRGFATEAVRAVMDWVTRSSDLVEISTLCDCEHHSSSKVLLSSGFKEQELIKNHLFLPAFGTKRDVFRYVWKRKQG